MKKSMMTAAVLIAATTAALAGAGAAVAAPDASAPQTGGPSAPQGGSAPADATKQTRGGTEAVGGGIWTYGVGGGSVTSVFENHKFVHSTAVKSSGVTKSSGKKPKGTLAVASRPSALFGNESFWNIY